MGKKILMALILMGAMSGPGLAGEDDWQDILDAIEDGLKTNEEMIKEIMRLRWCKKNPGSRICEEIDK